MYWLRKFLRLSSTERYMLLRATLLLGTIGLGLRFLPFGTFWSIFARMSSPACAISAGAGRAYLNRVVWAVSAAGRHMPGGGRCLFQALAAKVLLSRRGLPALLRIGVDRRGERGMQAHAWVECGGRVVIGGADDLSSYAPLLVTQMET